MSQPDPVTDADERRTAACLKACRGIKTEMLELPGARCMPILGIKEGDREGLCLLVERSAYDALEVQAEEGAQYRRWFDELAKAIIEHLDPEDTIGGGLIPKVRRAGRQMKDDAVLRGVMEQIAKMTEGARGGSLGMRVHDVASDALDTLTLNGIGESEDRNAL